MSIDQANPTSIVDQGDSWDTNSNNFEFTDKSIRIGFLRKIYGILTLQLFFTFGIVAIVTFQDGIKEIVQDYILYFLLIPLSFIIALTITVFVKKNLSKMFPINFILLVLFTILTTMSVSAVASYFNGYLVLTSGGITLFVVFSTFLYTLQSRWNINFWSGLILTLLGATLMSAIMYFALPEKEVIGYKIWIIVAVSILLSTYIAIIILGTIEGWFGQSSPEDYIQAIFKVYLGTLVVFIIVLGILALIASDGKGCSSGGSGSCNHNQVCVGCYWGSCYSGSRNVDSEDEESRS